MISVTMPEAREAMTTIELIFKRTVPVDIANTIGGMYTTVKDTVSALENPDDNEALIDFDIEPLPYSLIKAGLGDGWPIFFVGAIRKFFNFEA